MTFWIVVDILSKIFLGFVLGLLFCKWGDVGKNGEKERDGIFLMRINAIKDTEDEKVIMYSVVGDLWESKKKPKVNKK